MTKKEYLQITKLYLSGHYPLKLVVEMFIHANNVHDDPECPDFDLAANTIVRFFREEVKNES
jgi:hypothetical protein